jgi:carboxypeptidase Taq
MNPYEECMRIYSDWSALNAATSLMSWDRQLFMPKQGNNARNKHLMLLTQKMYYLLTSDKLSNLIDLSKSNASENQLANLILLQKEINKLTNVPLALVLSKTIASGNAYEQWVVSKRENDFSSLAQHYEELFEIARKTGQYLGYVDNLYDPLIDQYEEGSNFHEATSILEQLVDFTLPLISKIKESGIDIDNSFISKEFPPELLKSVMERISRQIGFDYNLGRLDICNNAFCTTISSSDVRMTTRPSNHLKGIVSSSLHEMGHGLYEQKQQSEWKDSPLSGGVSLAVHESQSRTWENVIGRSYEFWSFFWPWLVESFPELKKYSVDQFYKAFNKVEPSFTRVGSDELHYNLHIAIRFKIESQIVNSKLKVSDIPEAWNELYFQYFGAFPPNDTIGCLQDVHWARGSVGYFPTYSYGNLIGVQIWNTLKKDVTNTSQLMSDGEFSPIMDWLTENLYRRGKLIPPKELLVDVTGSDMSAIPWQHYVEDKYKKLYNI